MGRDRAEEGGTGRKRAWLLLNPYMAYREVREKYKLRVFVFFTGRLIKNV